MLSEREPYGSTFEIYRNATRQITTWLVSTARYDNSLDDSLDGKSAVYSTSSSANCHAIDIPLDRFIELVKAIRASGDYKVKLPEDIAGLINHVIDQRTEAEAFLARFKTSCQETRSELPSTLSSILRGLLEHLPSSALEDATAISSSCELHDSTEYNIELSEDERAFGAYALFKDFHDIREYLRTIWTDYLDGNMDVMNAAVVTDTAFAVLKRSCEDVGAELDIDSYRAMISILSNHLDEAEDTNVEFRDWICKDTLGILQNYVKLLQINPMPVPIPGAFGTYDPKQDRSQLSRAEQRTEDHVLLMELLPEFSYIERGRLDFPAQDILTTSLKETIKSRQTEDIPPHTLFATQILLDIHHILRDRADDAFKELRITAKRTLRTIDDYFRFSESKTNEGWTSEHSEMLSHFRDFVVHWTLTDQVGGIHRGAAYGMKPRPFYLLRNHPVLCGLLVFRLKLVMNDIGITVCNAFGSVSQAAHLYRCARLSGGLEREWEDMDFLLSAQDSQHHPLHASRCCRDSDSAISVATTNCYEAIDGRRCESCPAFGDALVKLKSNSPVKNIFSSRYIDDGFVDLSRVNVDAAIAGISNAELEDTPFSSLDDSLTHKLENADQITQVEFLKFITASMASENVQLRFDLFALHRHASTFLETAFTHIGGAPSQSQGADPPKDGYQGTTSCQHPDEGIAHLENHIKKLSTVLDVFLQVGGGGGSCLAAARQSSKRRSLVESLDSRRTSLALSWRSVSWGREASNR